MVSSSIKTSFLNEKKASSFVRTPVSSLLNSNLKDQSAEVWNERDDSGNVGLNAKPGKPLRRKINQVATSNPDHNPVTTHNNLGTDRKVTTPTAPIGSQISNSAHESDEVEVIHLGEKPGYPIKAAVDEKTMVAENPDTGEQEPKFRGKSALQRTATTQSELFEFGDDETNDRKLKATGNQFFFPEFEVVGC